MCIEQIEEIIVTRDYAAYEELASHIESLLEELHNTIFRELRNSYFFRMSSEKIDFYECPNGQFGQIVVDRFPCAIYEIEEAGKCLAFGRSTAAVFHLMRIMELAVQELGSRLGINLASEQNWQVILDQVNASIKRLPDKTREEKDLRIKYAACSVNLFNVKVAWRNEVMHPHAKYTEEEAQDIFNHVKIFIQYFVKGILP